MGSGGLHSGNCHTDLLSAAGGHCFTQPTLTSPISLRVKQNPMMIEQVSLDFLLPHKLFSIMYESFPKAFLASMLGDTETNIPEFWEAMKNYPQVLTRPQLRDRQDLHKVVPLAIHGDGVARTQAARAAGKSRSGFCPQARKGVVPLMFFGNLILRFCFVRL